MYALSGRAQKKWDELDVDGSDALDGDELMALAEWVWCSFRPGQEISASQRVQEATKLMGRCDTDGNGSIGREEFGKYYEKISGEMCKFRKEQEAKACARAGEEAHEVQSLMEAHGGEVPVEKLEAMSEEEVKHVADAMEAEAQKEAEAVEEERKAVEAMQEGCLFFSFFIV